jgi:PKHD-type hydroxylase
MLLDNYYWYFQSAINPETCQKIIDLGESRLQEIESSGGSTSAVTFGDNQKGVDPDAIAQNDLPLVKMDESKTTYIRDSEVAWLNDQWLFDLFYPFIHTANKSAGWKWQFDNSESFQFTKYANNQFYGWHADGQASKPYKRYLHGISPEPLRPDGRIPTNWVTNPALVKKIRKISMTVNLCPDNSYEGGELKFDFGLHKKESERFHLCTEIRPQGSIIIFPSFLYHCVAPVTKGTRYSLVLWALGDEWK